MFPIPKEIPGDTPEAKRANYADYLAAQVRLSYPTAAVAQMVKSGDLPLTGAAPGASDQVHAFLTEHQGKFEIGVQPVQQYIARNNLQVADETVPAGEAPAAGLPDHAERRGDDRTDEARDRRRLSRRALRQRDVRPRLRSRTSAARTGGA